MAEPDIDKLQSEDPAADATNAANPSGLAGFINPVLGLLSIGANLFNTYHTNKTNAANVAATNQANADLWREQSLYNSPAEQLKRLKMAGINPSLYYGKNGMENMAGAPPAMQPAVAQSYMIDPLTAAQISKINAETKSITHSTAREDELHPFNKAIFEENVNKAKEEARKAQIGADLLSNEYKKSAATLDASINSELSSLEALAEKGRLDKDEAAEARKNVTAMAKAALDSAQAEAKRLMAIADMQDDQKELLKKQLQQYEQLVEKLSKENDWFVVDRIVGYISQLGGVAANFTQVGVMSKMMSQGIKVSSAAAGAKSAKAAEAVDLSGYNLYD